MSGLDPTTLTVGLLGLFFVVLVGLAARKMVSGRPPEGDPPEELAPGDSAPATGDTLPGGPAAETPVDVPLLPVDGSPEASEPAEKRSLAEPTAVFEPESGPVAPGSETGPVSVVEPDAAPVVAEPESAPISVVEPDAAPVTAEAAAVVAEPDAAPVVADAAPVTAEVAAVAAEPEPEASSVTVERPPAETERTAMGRGLKKTRQGFMARLNAILFARELDEDLVDELEALLVTSDIGIRTTTKLLGDLREQLSNKEVKDPEAVRQRLKDRVLEIVSRPLPPLVWGKNPTVVMVIGVNGAGKTTTIGKLAARLKNEGRSVVLAAGDTFRAAAVEQLEVWGHRAEAAVVKGEEAADPASVIFEAIQRARGDSADVVLADTAGRLHTKVNLMEELKKVRRVMNKAYEGAPHEVLLVLDATNGQNAIAQAKRFKDAVEVDSIALTKLDGTAKGGVVVAICDDLELPVRYVGVGEQVQDLRDFDPEAFTEALFDRS